MAFYDGQRKLTIACCDPAMIAFRTRLLVLCAQPANVDTVIVDGRLLKRNGRLVDVDVGQIVSQAAASLAAIRQRAKLPPLDLNA